MNINFEKPQNRNYKMESKLKEMPQTYHLSDEEIKFYYDNGYLVIKELIDFASLYSYKQRFLQISKGLVEGSQFGVIKEPSLKNEGVKGEALINKLQDIASDDVFFTYISHPRIIHVVTQIIGDHFNAVHSMMINKPPGTGRHPGHQDMFYFAFRPIEKVVGLWTAIDDVTRENGALYVVPGSHKPGILYPHEEKKDASKLFHAVAKESILSPVEKRVTLEMSPGDTLLIHPLLIHGSGPNITKNYRKAISCHYASTDCYYIDVKGTVHETVARDVENLLIKRGFTNTSYIDVWRFKSKPVTGVKSHL